MKYYSPFHLLPVRDTQALTADGLKRWKKELMLQFDLNQSPVVEINGKEYDKNDVLQAFDLLKDTPDYHLRLYQNKPLLNFIEQGDFDFFKHEKNWADFWDTPYRDWIGQWFIPAYDSMVYGLVEDKSFEALEDLQNLESSKFQLPDSWGYEAHQKAYRHLSQFIERADVALDNMPPVESPKIKLHEELREYVDIYYANLMNLLPQEFEGLQRQYGNFAHNVIASIFHKERKFRDIERESLIALREAARIDIKIRNDEYSRGLLPLIEQYLLEREESTKEKSNYWLWILFVVAIFALRVCRNMPSNDNKFASTTIIEHGNNIDYFKDVKKDDIIGTWNAGISPGNSQKILKFTNDSSGVMMAFIQNISNDLCEISGEFTWTLVGQDLDVYFKNIRVLKEFDYPQSTHNMMRDGIVNSFSESLTVRAMKRDGKLTILRLKNGEITYRRDDTYIKAPTQKSKTEKEKFHEEAVYVLSRYQRSASVGQFAIQRNPNGDWYAHYTDEKVLIAKSKLYYGKHVLVPVEWTKHKGSWSYGGHFEDIRYTDANNRTYIGDLDMYFTLVDGLQVKFKAGTQGIQADKIQEKTVEEAPPSPANSMGRPNEKLSATPLELPKMMKIPAGIFMMGCVGSDCNNDEKPIHKVTLKGFKMSRYEITNAQYCVFLNEKKKHSGTKTWLDIDHASSGIALTEGVYSPKPGKQHQPVVKVTWYGATSYCLWLSKKTGKKYRLPTEAQWEYAARGGTTHRYAGSNNANLVACYYENNRQICPVNSTRQANGYGLYDMSGNVWEWCADWYKENHYAKKTSSEKGPSSGSKRVLRGGAWTEEAQACRVSHRSWYYPTYSSNNLGFRCVVND